MDIYIKRGGNKPEYPEKTPDNQSGKMGFTY